MVKIEGEDDPMAEAVPVIGGPAEAPDATSDEAAHHGIRHVTIEQFEFGGYRYTNLKDAVAEAKRHATKARTP